MGSFKVMMPKNKLVSYIFQGGRGEGWGSCRRGEERESEKKGAGQKEAEDLQPSKIKECG